MDLFKARSEGIEEREESSPKIHCRSFGKYVIVMSSTEANETTEDCTTTQSENASRNVKLDNLNCPFNWELSIRFIIKDETILAAKTSQQFQKIVDRQESFPEQVLLYHLMLAYENTIKDNLPGAMEQIMQAEQSLVDIKQRGELKPVERVLQYLFIGTKCHVLDELEQLSEIDELLEELCDVEDMNELELAMLNGCRCSIFLMLNTKQLSEYIECATTAIKYDPGNGKWHFLLGESYRLFRKSTHELRTPLDKEISAFKEAYRLFPNVLFGATLAQTYRESRDFDMALQIYKEVWAYRPTSCLVRFQLAIGFIRSRECALAKECLDYIAERSPDSMRYLHYMGIYEEKCNKDFMAALPHYKRATELGNFGAEWDYVLCRKRVEPDWDPLPHMLDASEMYKSHCSHSTVHQEINIQIGLYYIFEKHNVLFACPYLRRAIEIDPDAKSLRKSSLVFDRSHHVNVYHVLAKEIQCALHNGTTMYDDVEMTVLEETLALCRVCTPSAPSYAFPRAQPSGSRFSNSNKNYDRGSSSRVQVNWREERSGSSSLDFSKNYPSRRSNDAFNSPKRYSGLSHDRDYTSWRSDKQKTLDSLENRLDNRGSASVDRTQSKDGQQPSYSHRNNSNTGSGNHATCSLVKNVKDLNL